MAAAVSARARQPSLARSVHIAGAQTNVALWYRAAEIMVIPSLTEGLSNTMIEAMACGLPVIAVDAHGPAEIVEPETGWLVPPDDETALTDALVVSANDRVERQRRGTHALLHAQRHFSWQRIARRVAQVYAQADLVVDTVNSSRGRAVRPGQVIRLGAGWSR